MNSTVIEVQNLVKYFPVRTGVIVGRTIGNVKAVDDISFEVSQGETFALVGESGCGKTTVANLILKLLDPTSGDILFQGKSLKGASRSEPIEVRGTEPEVTESIRLEASRVNRLLGTEITDEEIAGFLARVGVECSPEGKGIFRCAIPTHRNDLHRLQDLIEEVSRIYGYDRIETTLPVASLRGVELSATREIAERTRDSLCASGLLEAIVLPFLSRADLDGLRLPEDDPRRKTVQVETSSC